jgi:hypothetical protein
MKHFAWGLAALALVAAGPATAGDIEFKPIDTTRYVVKPTRTAADLTSRTINMMGQTAADSIKNNGYVKTINNLFSKKIIVPHTQAGPSPLPAPTMFQSTQYKNYNTPLMPIMQRVRR